MSQITDRIVMAQMVDRFLEENKHGYTPFELEYLKKNWANHLTNRQFQPDILRQIYSELGFITPEKDIYEGFINILEQNFDIDTDIIEVGGGRIPSLAKKIALKQKKGTITVYDPRLISTYTERPNMILKKENFGVNTHVKSGQLIIGFMPCEATEKIIMNAERNNAHFLIALCEGGPHGDEYDYFESIEEWLGSMIYSARNVARKNNKGPLQQTDLSDYEDPYPVIYTKKR